MRLKNLNPKKILSRRYPLLVGAVLATLFSLMISAAPGYAAAATSKDFGTCPSSNNVQNNCIVRDVNVFIDFLSAGVGVIVLGYIIVGAIQYTVAGDNPTVVTAAKKRMTNALIALVGFALVFAFLQWLIPGGVFKP